MTQLSDRTLARALFGMGFSAADTEFLILVGYCGNFNADYIVREADNILCLRNDYQLSASDCADSLQDAQDEDYPDYE